MVAEHLECANVTEELTFFFFLTLFIYLFNFLATLGLCCCVRAFSSCFEQGLLFVAVRRLLIEVASRCGAQALGTWAPVVVACGLSSCGSWAQQLWLAGPRVQAQ